LLGKFVIQDLKSHKVDIKYMKTLPGLTASAIDILSGSGEKSELVYRGAVSALGPKHLSENMIKNSKRIFITSMVSGKNYALFKKITAAAKKHNKPIIFAPSITMLRKHASKLRKIRSEITIMNYEEGKHLTKKNKIKDVLKSLPGKIKVITMGSKGSYATDGKQIIYVKALKVKIKDTTGAGDCFSGAFAHAYYKHEDLTASLKEATAAAALKIQSEGARFYHNRKNLEKCLKKFSKHLQPKIIK